MNLRFVPNLICILRMVLVVPIIMFLVRGRYAEALLLFFVAGFSDGLDGFLARRYHWRTRLGAILDPLADKLLMFSVYITLTVIGLNPLWLALVVVGRDLLIIGGGFAYHYLVRPIEGEPSVVSKINTGFQLLYVLSVLSAAAWPAFVPDWLVLALGSVVFVTTVVSGIDYVWQWSMRAYRVSHEPS